MIVSKSLQTSLPNVNKYNYSHSREYQQCMLYKSTSIHLPDIFIMNCKSNHITLNVKTFYLYSFQISEKLPLIQICANNLIN